MLMELKEQLAEDQKRIAAEAYFEAAVLVPLLNFDADPAVLFEVRSTHLAWQPGEICFPGGRLEEQDESTQRAAIRETCEELGMTAEQICVIGAMAPISSPIGVLLHPCVGRLEGAINPNTDEVAETFAVPLAELLAIEPAVGRMELATRPADDFPAELLPGYETGWKKRKTYPVYFYRWRDKVIWGLTALVLRRFLESWRRAASEKASRDSAGKTERSV